MIKFLAISTGVLVVLLLISGALLQKSYKANGVLETNLATAEASLISEQENKLITEEVDNALQNANNERDTRANRLLQKPAKCIPVPPRNPRRDNATSERQELTGTLGIGEGRVILYLREGDTYRAQVMACQQYLAAVKKKYSYKVNE